MIVEPTVLQHWGLSELTKIMGLQRYQFGGSLYRGDRGSSRNAAAAVNMMLSTGPLLVDMVPLGYSVRRTHVHLSRKYV